MNKRVKYGFAMAMMGVLLFSGCGSADDSQLKMEMNKSDDVTVTTAEPEVKTDMVVASACSGDYTVEVVLKEGQYIEDELSPYKGTYEGEYEIRLQKDKEVCAELPLNFDDSVEKLNFPAEQELLLTDYNGDGQDDFAIGQSLSSNAKKYQFYTITKDGKLEELNGNIVADAEYFPLFDVEEGKICYRQYNQDSGEYDEKEFGF